MGGKSKGEGYNRDMNYVAGESNIGKEQAKRRSRDGWMAVGVAVLWPVLHVILSAPQYLMFLVGVPVFIASLRFLEARSHFAVHYGLHGLFDMGEGLRHTENNEEYHLDDRSRAQALLVYATGIAFLIALLAYFVLV